jgi:GNAT superfamily N-acetyltransferase
VADEGNRPAEGRGDDWIPAESLTKAAVRIEPLTEADVAAAVQLVVRVLRVKPGDRGEQFAADITGERRQIFVAKASDRIVAYGRVLELAADEAGPGTPAGCYLSGVLVEPAWRGRGIATALTRARLNWAFARTGTVFYVTGADNTASLHLHAAFGFQAIKCFGSERSAAGVDVLSQLGEEGGRPRSEGRWCGNRPTSSAGDR